MISLGALPKRLYDNANEMLIPTHELIVRFCLFYILVWCKYSMEIQFYGFSNQSLYTQYSGGPNFVIFITYKGQTEIIPKNTTCSFYHIHIFFIFKPKDNTLCSQQDNKT